MLQLQFQHLLYLLLPILCRSYLLNFPYKQSVDSPSFIVLEAAAAQVIGHIACLPWEHIGPITQAAHIEPASRAFVHIEPASQAFVHIERASQTFIHIELADPAFVILAP